MMPKRKVEDLFDGVTVTVDANGKGELWLANADGTRGFRVRASNGPAGISLQIDALNPLARGLDAFGGDGHLYGDIGGITVTNYYGDEKSQSFRRLYIGNGDVNAWIAEHGDFEREGGR